MSISSDEVLQEMIKEAYPQEKLSDNHFKIILGDIKKVIKLKP